jgi:hypothetical protein
MNGLAIHSLFDGRSDGYEGSTNRVLLQLAAGLPGRRLGRGSLHTRQLRNSPDDEQDYATDNKSARKNDNEPKYVSEHGKGPGGPEDYFFFPFFEAGADGFLYSVEICALSIESMPLADSALAPSGFKERYFSKASFVPGSGVTTPLSSVLALEIRKIPYW